MIRVLTTPSAVSTTIFFDSVLLKVASLGIIFGPPHPSPPPLGRVRNHLPFPFTLSRKHILSSASARPPVLLWPPPQHDLTACRSRRRNNLAAAAAAHGRRQHRSSVAVGAARHDGRRRPAVPTVLNTCARTPAIHANERAVHDTG